LKGVKFLRQKTLR